MERENKSTKGEFLMTRTFDAPCDLVFKSWTERERLMHWWGPKGFTMRACNIDLRSGGVFHYGMQAPDGGVMWGKWIFREIVRPERLIFVVSFSDEAGGETRHPWAPDWPLKTLSTLSFSEQTAERRSPRKGSLWMRRSPSARLSRPATNRCGRDGAERWISSRNIWRSLEAMSGEAFR
jgi:uncharacterized protein YndB with AHSA1/START domain